MNRSRSNAANASSRGQGRNAAAWVEEMGRRTQLHGLTSGRPEPFDRPMDRANSTRPAVSSDGAESISRMPQQPIRVGESAQLVGVGQMETGRVVMDHAAVRGEDHLAR